MESWLEEGGQSERVAKRKMEATPLRRRRRWAREGGGREERIAIEEFFFLPSCERESGETLLCTCVEEREMKRGEKGI